MVLGFWLSACSQADLGAVSEEPALDLSLVSRGDMLAVSCSGCHTGKGGSAIPEISGLSAERLRASLLNYRAETSGSGVMHRIMRGYSDEDIDEMINVLTTQRKPEK